MKKKSSLSRKGQRVINSIASYHTDDVPILKLDEMAETLSKVYNVPERIGFFRATEISMFAQSYILLKKELKKLRKARIS